MAAGALKSTSSRRSFCALVTGLVILILLSISTGNAILELDYETVKFQLECSTIASVSICSTEKSPNQLPETEEVAKEPVDQPSIPDESTVVGDKGPAATSPPLLRKDPREALMKNSFNATADSPTTSVDKEVHFLTRKDFVERGEMYSGMWWQNRTAFLSQQFHRVTRLEDASMIVFGYQENASFQRKLGGGGLRLTRDWLDFSVEHLSKYVKYLDWIRTKKGMGFLRPRLEQIIQRYIEKTTHLPIVMDRPEFAVHRSIAVLPFRTGDKIQKLTILQLAATIASLWRVGIGRAIVVGVSDGEERNARAAFQMLEEKLKSRPMEIAYVQHINATGAERKVVPKVALEGLQRVMNDPDDTSAEVQAWLGSAPSQWQYVYFTEPDLVLQTHPSAMAGLTKALQEGKLLAAHRLEPLPHARDFPTNTSQRPDQMYLVPDVANFTSIEYLADSHVCCDQGKYYPAHVADPSSQEKVRKLCYGRIWSHCGFVNENTNYTEPSVVLRAHSRLLEYPLFALESGTGLPLVSGSQRVCVPERTSTAQCPDMSNRQKVSTS